MASTPCDRAITATAAPGTNVSLTIVLRSTLDRLRRLVGPGATATSALPNFALLLIRLVRPRDEVYYMDGHLTGLCESGRHRTAYRKYRKWAFKRILLPCRCSVDRSGTGGAKVRFLETGIRDSVGGHELAPAGDGPKTPGQERPFAVAKTDPYPPRDAASLASGVRRSRQTLIRVRQAGRRSLKSAATFEPKAILKE